MKKQNEALSPEDIKTDLKHDTMEFSAATDGDDKLDTDDETFEEYEITLEELEKLEDDPYSQASALSSAEAEKQAGSDNLPEEDWQDDLPDGNAEKENDDKELHRH